MCSLMSCSFNVAEPRGRVRRLTLRLYMPLPFWSAVVLILRIICMYPTVEAGTAFAGSLSAAGFFSSVRLQLAP